MAASQPNCARSAIVEGGEALVEMRCLSGILREFARPTERSAGFVRGTGQEFVDVRLGHSSDVVVINGSSLVADPPQTAAQIGLASSVSKFRATGHHLETEA